MNSRALVLVLVVSAVGFFGGYGFGFNRSHRGHEAGSVAKRSGVVTALAEVGSTRERLAEVSRNSGESIMDRYRAYLDLISEAGPSDYPDLYRSLLVEPGCGALAEGVLERWLAHDSLEVLDALIGGAIPMRARASALFSCVCNHADEAWAMIEGSRPGTQRDELQWVFLQLESQVDPPRCTVRLFEIHRWPFNSGQAQTVLNNLAKSNAGGLAEVEADRLSVILGKTFSADILRQMAEVSPAKALEVSDRIQNFDARLDAEAAVVAGWFASEPDAAREWVDRVQPTPGARRDALLGGLAKGLVRSGPHAAAEQALKIVSPSLRSRVLGEVIHKWGNMESGAGERWAKENLSGRVLTDVLEFGKDPFGLN